MTHATSVPEEAPWYQEAFAVTSGIDGAALFGNVEAFLSRFVAYPNGHCRVAHVLWVAHAHCMDSWESTPRLAFLSPEPASGKSRALEVTELLVPRPVAAVSATPAYLFRKVSDSAGRPTILFDEIDTVFGPKAKEHEELRGLLNAGHRKGAMAGRCKVTGKTVETEELPSYCAVALAGLGKLPDTILTRSVIIQMRRRAPSETVEPFRHRVHAQEGNALRDELATFIQVHAHCFANTYPEMPDGVEDRAADVWEPLLSIADAVGGDWPRRARVAAVALVTAARDSAPSLGVRLLADLRTIFDGGAAASTEKILAELHKMEDAPWAKLKGEPLDSRGLAYQLKAYGVKSKTVRIGTATPRGYSSEDLFDAWHRYLPPVNDATSATSLVAADVRCESR